MAVARKAAARPKAADRPTHIRPTSEGGLVRWLNYGMPGVGKSKIIGTSAAAKPSLVLANSEDETVSINSDKVFMWHTPNVADLTEALEELRHGAYKDYAWIWLDNATLLQEQNMDWIMANLVAGKPHRSVYKPDKAEYGENQNMLGLFIRNFVNLPTNIGITAHVMEAEDISGKPTYLPLLQGGKGQLSQKVCGYMNVVTYMDVLHKEGKGIRRLHFQKTGKIFAKDRFGAFGDRMTDPTIAKMEKILASRKSKETK
jgi:hypothetical protein